MQATRSLFLTSFFIACCLPYCKQLQAGSEKFWPVNRVRDTPIRYFQIAPKVCVLFIILVAETHDCHRMWSGPGDFSSPTSSYSSELHIYYVRCLLQFIGYHGNKITRLHVTFVSLLIITIIIDYIGLGAPGRVSCAKGKVGFRSGEMAGKGGANFIPSYLNVCSKILQYIWQNI